MASFATRPVWLVIMCQRCTNRFSSTYSSRLLIRRGWRSPRPTSTSAITSACIICSEWRTSESVWRAWAASARHTLNRHAASHTPLLVVCRPPRYFKPTLKKFYHAAIGSVSSKSELVKQFSVLSLAELRQLFARLKLPVPSLKGLDDQTLRSFMLDCVGSAYELHKSQVHAINEYALFPTESLLWDNDLIPIGAYNGECGRVVACILYVPRRPSQRTWLCLKPWSVHPVPVFAGTSVLAMPKLNLQFLTVYDYLLRSFKLFRLESAYQIRMDLVDAIRHMKPRRLEDGSTAMGGWARMALPLKSFTLTEVSKPRLGETKPAAVKAEIEIDLRQYGGVIREEWEQIREHDVLFLVTIEVSIHGKLCFFVHHHLLRLCCLQPELRVETPPSTVLNSDVFLFICLFVCRAESHCAEQKGRQWISYRRDGRGQRSQEKDSARLRGGGGRLHGSLWCRCRAWL